MGILHIFDGCTVYIGCVPEVFD